MQNLILRNKVCFVKLNTIHFTSSCTIPTTYYDIIYAYAYFIFYSRAKIQLSEEVSIIDPQGICTYIHTNAYFFWFTIFSLLVVVLLIEICSGSFCLYYVMTEQV
jgi:hypothetical protein